MHLCSFVFGERPKCAFFVSTSGHLWSAGVMDVWGGGLSGHWEELSPAWNYNSAKDHTRQVSRATDQEALLHHPPARESDHLYILFVAVRVEANARTPLSLSSA